MFDIFLIFAQNIDCGYSLEPPRQIGIPLIPRFCYIKVGFKGVYITRTCFPDVYCLLCFPTIVFRTDCGSDGPSS